jgi:D-glycero-alpha-D-manno-heptose-7-phosphate kinase
MSELLVAPHKAPNVRALLDHSARVTKVRARAPLRLGFAGGGTDVSPYSDTFGGCVLNATIGMFAHCSIEVRSDQKVKFVALDHEQEVESHTDADITPSGPLALHKAVYRRIVRQYLGGACLPVTVMTASDAPAGSGLGSSSTLVVAMIEAYRELLALPLGEYDVAHLAYVIEREDVGQAGGRQDQYAATFGGINFIEFTAGQAIVNPLRIRQSTLMELEAMLVLYLTGISRESAKIIAQQSATLRSGHEAAATGDAPDQTQCVRDEGCAVAQ